MVKWKSDKILGSKWNAGAVTADNRQEMGIGERIHVDFHTATSPARELENLFVLPAGPFHLPLVPPFPAPPPLNFLTKFHTHLVVSWLFVSGTLPAGVIYWLLQKTNLSSISHVLPA